MRPPLSRRDFLSASAAGAFVASSSCAQAEVPGVASAHGAAVPHRPLGATGVHVSIMGIGGAHLGDVKDANEAQRIVDQAIDAGVSFFDNAWEYHDGKSEEVMGKTLAGKRERVFLMTKVCTHGRGADVRSRRRTRPRR